LEPAAQANAVATNNVGFSAPGTEKTDVVLKVSPQLQLSGIGSRYRVLGTLGFDSTTYLLGSASGNLMPRIGLTASGVLVDRLLFVDSELFAGPTASNAFGVLSEGQTTFNQGTATRERLSPYISREIGPRTNVLLRSDNTWVQTEYTNVIQQKFNSYVQSDEARFDLKPQPVGLRAAATRLNSRNDASRVGSNTVFDIARLTALYAPVPEVQFGVVGGRERATYGLTKQTGTVSGGSLRWSPNERTVFDGVVEKRFFGTGWDLNFTHRSPFVSISAVATREVTTYSALLAALQPGSSNSVSSLLDAALTTQYPNAAQRGVEVANLISKYNLPSNLSSALSLYTNTAQILQRVNIAMALLGSRHTVTFSVFKQEGRDLLGPNDSPPLPLNSADARQLGGTVNVSRRLTPDMTADVSLTGVRILGYGLREGQRTINKIARVGGTQNLSPRTSVTAGFRRQLVNATGVLNVTPSAQVTSIYVGALHRF
jgi:uncharacterized protein (PEP-CTERM system associated)